MKKYRKKRSKHAAGVSEVKASLSEYLARVKAGEEIIVTERGKPVARLVPMDTAADGDAGRAAMRELAREGLARMGRGGIPRGFWDLPRPLDPEDRALELLLEERRTGR